MTPLALVLLLLGVSLVVSGIALGAAHAFKVRKRKAYRVTATRMTPVKIAAVLAVHTNTPLKQKVARLCAQRLRDAGVERVVLVNSTGLLCDENELHVDNNARTLDHAKFIRGLEGLAEFDAVILMNDSCIVTAPLNDFVDLIRGDGALTQLYGYVESLEVGAHFQSMLRAFNREGAQRFAQIYRENEPKIQNVTDLIRFLEIGIMKHFPDNKCLHRATGKHNRHYSVKDIIRGFKDGYALLKLKALYEPDERFPDKTAAPKDFSPAEYKRMYHELEALPDKDCWAHFLKHGQNEMRVYSETQKRHMIPAVREKLAQCCPELLTELPERLP